MRSDVAGVHREVLPAALLRLASDERLVAYVRAGSERAFEVLFDRHHRAVLAFCRQMLGSSADAEDAVQHTFFAAYRDLMRSEKPIVLRPWLYAIARHRCVSMLRGCRERPVAELPEPASDHLAAELALREDLRTALIDVARLPDDQRAALILAELGDVSHEEIARILGCRRDKVKALVFQARSSLSADRTARETPCSDIREQLATLGGALRHATLRRHLRECTDCRTFRHQMRSQRRRLGVFLPIAPGLGFKRSLLGALSGWGGAGAGATGVTAGALSSGGLAAAVLVTAAVAAGGGGAAGTPASRHAERTRPVAAATTNATHVVRTSTVQSPHRTKGVVVVRPRDRTVTHVRDTARGEPAPVVARGKTPAPEPANEPDTRRPIAKPTDATPGPAPVNDRPANSRRNDAPGRPTGPPVANDQRRPVAPARANGQPKPVKATRPETGRQATPAPAESHGKPPSGPSPATPATPEPSPPPNSNAGGSGNGGDEVNGHKGQSGKP